MRCRRNAVVQMLRWSRAMRCTIKLISWAGLAGCGLVVLLVAGCGGANDIVALPGVICPPAVAPWSVGSAYVVGSFVRYDGNVYECLQAHTAVPLWAPDLVPALWSAVLCSGGAPGTGGSTDLGAATAPPASSDLATGASGDDLAAPAPPVTGAGDMATKPPPSSPSDLAEPPPPPPATPKLLVGYFQSWSDPWQASGAATTLAQLPSYLNVVNLAYMEPDTKYVKGSYDLSTTGLGFAYSGTVLRDAVAAAHQNRPGSKILVAVGGSTFTAWSAFNASAVAAFVSDFGLDGVDLDYQPVSAACTSNGTVSCPSDGEYVGVVNAMRAAMARPRWLTLAAWNVGAYGEGSWQTAPPASSSMGIALAVLKNAGSALDLVNVMSYDGSPTYSPAQALAAYQHYFKGPIAMGVEVPPESWGGHVETLAEVDALADAVSSAKAAGLMIWSVQKAGPAQQFASEMCTKLGLSSCTTPLF
jgi:chitinase